MYFICITISFSRTLVHVR